MADFATSIDIAASPERVWAVLSDLERWPDWTPSMRSLKRLDSGPLAVGSTVRVHQPKLRPANFVVTRLEPGRGFDWVTRSIGLTVTGRHWIEPISAGSRVTLSIHFVGTLAPLITWLTRRLIVRYVDLEANGLKQRSEAKEP